LALVRKELNSMGDLCRKILLMYFFDGYDMKTIAEANNLSNANTAKSKKYQCLKELTNQVKSQYQKSDFL
jgi:DNA-directed RNA polymerase specialized sigma24 family protein